MSKEQNIDDLVNMLDSIASKGAGHINVIVENPEEVDLQDASITEGCNCEIGDTACKIPNMPLYGEDGSDKY
ncbi:MAG: hypothetical protein PHI41_01690 [Erysipelotrichaceae bacterium]|nr:hypothetical protein [Erysipelotrichaceae bacterium]MDD3809562.1 hypothetical protein [Erysipelotrichaceae bacterium]